MVVLATAPHRRHLTAVEVKDYLDQHDLQRNFEGMMTQVFELQPEDPFPFMIEYLRKHGGPSGEQAQEKSTWQRKYEEFAAAAAEREAALAARTAELEREVRGLVEIGFQRENSKLTEENSRLKQENAMLKLVVENHRLLAENKRLRALRGESVDVAVAEPYVPQGHVAAAAAPAPALAAETKASSEAASPGGPAEVSSEKPRETPADEEVAAEEPSDAPAVADDTDHHAAAAMSEASRLAKRFTLSDVPVFADDTDAIADDTDAIADDTDHHAAAATSEASRLAKRFTLQDVDFALMAPAEP
jgi:hypothetical protein